MTSRLLASVLWVPVMLVPATREMIAWASRLVWPSAQPFGWLGDTLGGALPFVTTVAGGYLLTAVVAEAVLRQLRRSGDAIERQWAAHHPGDGWTIAGAALLGGLGVLGALFGVMQWHWPAVAVLAMVGLLPSRTGLTKRAVEETPTLPDLLPIPGPPQPRDPPAPHVELLRYRWEWLAETADSRAGARPVIVEVVVPKSHYDDLRGRDHSVTSDEDYAGFARQGLADAAVGAVATQLRKVSIDLRLDAIGEIQLVMAMAQSFTYAWDQEEHGGEYPKFPAETLVDRRGDCEDFAILAATLLGWLGHRVALVLMRTGHTGHAAIAVGAPQPVEGLSFLLPSLGVEVFYAEVTPPGNRKGGKVGLVWKLGAQPHIDAERYAVYPLA